MFTQKLESILFVPTKHWYSSSYNAMIDNHKSCLCDIYNETKIWEFKTWVLLIYTILWFLMPMLRTFLRSERNRMYSRKISLLAFKIDNSIWFHTVDHFRPPGCTVTWTSRPVFFSLVALLIISEHFLVLFIKFLLEKLSKATSEVLKSNIRLAQISNKISFGTFQKK